jgi:single-strand DNA-binding protein
MLEVIIAGFIGSISALRHTKAGKAVCNMSIAENRRNGKTVWHRVVCFGAQAEACVTHLAAGSYVVVKSDTYVPNTYKGKDGSGRCSVEFWANKVSFGPKSKKDSSADNAADSFPGLPGFDDSDPMPF